MELGHVHLRVRKLQRAVDFYAGVFGLSVTELAAVHDRLEERDVAADPIDHGISRTLYFDDPDGNGVEAYLDTRDDADERWQGHSQPFDPATLE